MWFSAWFVACAAHKPTVMNLLVLDELIWFVKFVMLVNSLSVDRRYQTYWGSLTNSSLPAFQKPSWIAKKPSIISYNSPHKTVLKLEAGFKHILTYMSKMLMCFSTQSQTFYKFGKRKETHTQPDVVFFPKVGNEKSVYYFNGFCPISIY